MNKKKKRLIIICACVLAVLIAAGGVIYSQLPHPIDYKIGSVKPVGSSLQIVSEDEDTVTVKKPDGGEYKVLLFTDLHLDGKNATSRLTVSHLVENITREKPDLVLLGGDNVTSGLNRVRAKQLGRIFEQLEVYWGGVIGNHEGDNRFSIARSEMVEIFSSFPHCLMRGGPDAVPGDCNYALHLLGGDDALVQTFYFMDTFDEMTDEQKAKYGFEEGKTSKYAGVTEEQVTWYAGKVRETTAAYGAHDSIVMIHIPLPQYANVAQRGDFLYGVNLENCCVSGFDAGLFDAIKAGGSTKAVFCGHDHMNTFGGMEDGILLSYIEPGNYGSYNTGSRLGYEEKDWLQGYTRLILHEDGTFDQLQVRNSALAAVEADTAAQSENGG